MRTLLLFTSCLVALAAAGCNASSNSGDVPSQAYTSRLNALGKGSGDVAGRIVFPSEYSQRSATFYVDHVRFATLPDGRFRVTTVPIGLHDLRVFAPGFEPVTLPINVRDGGEVAVQPIQLRTARGKVVGRLVNEAGQSAPGIAVRLAPNGGATHTDKDGIFQFLGVGPGEIVLAVDDPYFTPQPQRFVLNRDEQRNLGNVRVGRAQMAGAGRTAEIAPSGDAPR